MEVSDRGGGSGLFTFLFSICPLSLPAKYYMKHAIDGCTHCIYIQGEDICVGAIREVKEETGVSAISWVISLLVNGTELHFCID